MGWHVLNILSRHPIICTHAFLLYEGILRCFSFLIKCWKNIWGSKPRAPYAPSQLITCMYVYDFKIQNYTVIPFLNWNYYYVEMVCKSPSLKLMLQSMTWYIELNLLTYDPIVNNWYVQPNTRNASFLMYVLLLQWCARVIGPFAITFMEQWEEYNAE